MRRKDVHALWERDHSTRIDWAVQVLGVGDAVAQAERSLGVVTITSKDDFLWTRRIMSLPKLEPDFLHGTSNVGSQVQRACGEHESLFSIRNIIFIYFIPRYLMATNIQSDRRLPDMVRGRYFLQPCSNSRPYTNLELIGGEMEQIKHLVPRILFLKSASIIKGTTHINRC